MIPFKVRYLFLFIIYFVIIGLLAIGIGELIESLNLSHIIIKLIIIFFAAYIIISTVIFFYWYAAPDARRRCYLANENIVIIVYIGSFLFLWLILGVGLNSLFTFIQDTWSWRWFIFTKDEILSASFLLGGLMAWFLGNIYEKLEKYREDENHFLKLYRECSKKLSELTETNDKNVN